MTGAEKPEGDLVDQRRSMTMARWLHKALEPLSSAWITTIDKQIKGVI